MLVTPCRKISTVSSKASGGASSSISPGRSTPAKPARKKRAAISVSTRRICPAATPCGQQLLHLLHRIPAYSKEVLLQLAVDGPRILQEHPGQLSVLQQKIPQVPANTQELLPEVPG